MTNLIYIADNNLDTARELRDFLEPRGYAVMVFPDPALLQAAFNHTPCSLAILDMDAAGLCVGAAIKQQAGAAVLLTAANWCQQDAAFSQRLGIDSYMAKPIDLQKLDMYVQALLARRKAPQAVPATVPAPPATAGQTLACADISVCQNRMMVFCNDKHIPLTGTEYRMLVYFLQNQDSALARKDILHSLWSAHKSVNPRAVDDVVKRLRAKLRKAGSALALDTVWGYGFRLCGE